MFLDCYKVCLDFVYSSVDASGSQFGERLCLAVYGPCRSPAVLCDMFHLQPKGTGLCLDMLFCCTVFNELYINLSSNIG